MAGAGKKKTEYDDIKLNSRTVLIGLWAALMLLYIYCDIYAYFRPNHMINELVNGFMGPPPVNQISSLTAPGILMALPALMIVANLFIKMAAINNLGAEPRGCCSLVVLDSGLIPL